MNMTLNIWNNICHATPLHAEGKNPHVSVDTCYKGGLVFPKTEFYWPKTIFRGAGSMFSLFFFC